MAQHTHVHPLSVILLGPSLEFLIQLFNLLIFIPQTHSAFVRAILVLPIGLLDLARFNESGLLLFFSADSISAGFWKVSGRVTDNLVKGFDGV